MTNVGALIAEYLDAHVARDSARLAQLFTEDAVWHTPPSALPAYRGQHRGRKAVVDLLTHGKLFIRGSEGLKIDHIVGEGNLAAAQFWRSSRTTAGPDYNNLYCFFFRCRDGQIAEVWEHL